MAKHGKVYICPCIFIVRNIRKPFLRAFLPLLRCPKFIDKARNIYAIDFYVLDFSKGVLVAASVQGKILEIFYYIQDIKGHGPPLSSKYFIKIVLYPFFSNFYCIFKKL